MRHLLLLCLLKRLAVLAGLLLVLFANSALAAVPQVYPGQLRGAADAADDCNGAVYGGADRWESERCDRGMERLDRTCQFVDGLQWKRLSVGGGTNGYGRALAGYLLREEHFGCRGRHECRDGDVQYSGYLPRTFEFWNIAGLIRSIPWTRSWGQSATAQRAAAAL